MNTAPSFPIRGNLVPTWKALCRKARVLATTSLRSVAVPASTDEFIAESIRIAGSANDHQLLDQKILALWQLEGLAFAFFEHRDDGQIKVEELGLPPEAGPPVHCGIAMAVPVLATARGVAAAFTLINSRDLGRVLSLRASEDNLGLTDGIEGGMMNTLVLLEWTFPGCLSSVAGVKDRGARLIAEAKDVAHAARRQGLGPPLVA